MVANGRFLAAEEIKTKTVAERKRIRASKRRNPTGKRIRRDGWLSPLSLGRKLAADPELHKSGFRASDKGFLSLSLEDYLALLRWTARQRVKDTVQKVPKALRAILSSIGIDASMWRDLVWNYKRYFGRSTCAGSPESMAEDAHRHGLQHHHGQRHASACFSAG